MNLYRNNAIMTGVLFIIATVTNMLGNLSIKPILGAPNYLIQISANENLMIIAALLVLISAFASASIAICLYPILKKYHGALALVLLDSGLWRLCSILLVWLACYHCSQ